MALYQQQLAMLRGDVATWDVVITKDAVVEDITGWTFLFTAKMRPDSDNTDASAAIKIGSTPTPQGSITILTPSAGLARITLLPPATDALVAAANFYADLQVVDNADVLRTPWTGRLRVDLDVTRRAS